MIDDFHLESLRAEELSSLRQALDAEEKRRTQSSKVAGIDSQIEALRKELETAPAACSSQLLRPTLYAGGWAPSQACHCKRCLEADIRILTERRNYMAEGAL